MKVQTGEDSDSENGEGNTDANDENNAPGEESDRSGGGNLPESAENSPLPSQAAETKANYSSLGSYAAGIFTDIARQKSIHFGI